MQFVGTFWALVPPIIAITLALITKEAYSSLFIGVVIGALFACNFAPVATIDMIVNDGIIAAIADNAGIFLFLVLLGIIVALVNLAGGSAAFGRWAEKNIHTRVGAQLATFILGILIFIDDYFNCLTVGSVMRPVTDRHQISRPKLAYLIDATAAPVCMIAPISSWAAAVSSTAEDLDTGISGIQLFIRAIPYNFYSLLTFVFIITLTLLKFDYGPMRGFEERARNTGDLSGSAGSTEENANPKGRVIDLVIPVIMLIILCTIGMLYVGGFFGADTSGCTDYAGDFIGAFGNTDAFVGLPWGGIIALVLTVIYLVARRVVGFREAMGCIPKGFQAMISPIIILTLAVSLKTTLNALGAADYVHDLMYAASEGLYNMLPAVIFLVACVLAFASGATLGGASVLTGTIDLTFTVSGKTVLKKFGWTKSIRGSEGASAVVFSIYAPEGTVVLNQSGSLTLATSAYSGATAITTGATYQWAKYTAGKWEDISGATSSTLTVSGADIVNIQSYRCTMSYGGKSYVDVITVEDKSDPYVSEMLSIGGFTVKNNLGGLVPYVIVRTNQKEVDPLLGTISETAPSSLANGTFWYKVDHAAKAVTLMKYNGTDWAAATETQSLTYTWYKQDKDGKAVAFDKTGKVIYLSAEDIDSIATLQCDVSNG